MEDAVLVITSTLYGIPGATLLDASWLLTDAASGGVPWHGCRTQQRWTSVGLRSPVRFRPKRGGQAHLGCGRHLRPFFNTL